MGDLILEVIEGPDAGKRVVVDKPIVVGRDPQADFVLQDREVSRRHAQLTPTGDYVTVEDLGSANGTFVNHNELHGPARLDAGDELLVGVSVLQLWDPAQVRASHSAVIEVPQGLARAPRPPAYADPQKVTAGLAADQGGVPELEKYLDVRVRRRAVNAPWLLAALVAIVVGAYFATKSSNSLAEGPITGWIYVDANTPTPNKNAVVAIPYTINGVPVIAKAKQYLTGGSGSPFVLPLPNSVGTTAGDHQVLLNPDHTLLFAVNQGSNSIAVFHVNAQTGALTPVAGSPFSSGGLAPIGLGYSNGILVVANHGVIAPFAPPGGSPPGPSNLVSFQVSSTGALTPVKPGFIKAGPTGVTWVPGGSTPPHPDGAVDATISPDGTTIVSTGFYPEIKKLVPPNPPEFSPELIRSFTLSSSGVLSPVPNPFPLPSNFSSTIPPAAVLQAAGVPPFVHGLAFGVAFNPDPTKRFVYIDATVYGRVAVYRYSSSGALTLVSSVTNPGIAACWIAISKDGRFLYDSNSATRNVTVFSISPDGSTLKLIQAVPLKSNGTTDSITLDPSGKWLYILGDHDDADALRLSPKPGGGLAVTPALDANFLDAYNVDPSTGKLTEIGGGFKLPVPGSNSPYGLDVLQKGG